MLMKSFTQSIFSAGLILAAVFCASHASAQDLRATGRQLAENYAGAIVNIQVVVSQKVSFQGQEIPEQEMKNEINGTVIAPDGTTIASLSEIDPSENVKRMFAAQADQDMTYDVRVKDLKLIVNKEKEIPATIVLRDPDLDIAVLRPSEEQEEEFKAIDLTNSMEPRLLEPCVVMARMPRSADRELAVMSGEIQSIITKPRTFYIPSAELASGGYGVPIFSADAKLIGLVHMRVIPGGEPGENTLIVVLPAADILEVANQAKDAG